MAPNPFTLEVIDSLIYMRILRVQFTFSNSHIYYVFVKYSTKFYVLHINKFHNSVKYRL